jgi:hypothetical protein
MSKSIWIDEHSCCGVADGEVGFLIWWENEIGPQGGYRLEQHPVRGNLSGQPILHGWAGTNNNYRTEGRGLAKAVKVAKNGRRRLELIEATEEILEELGYPELLEEA